MSLIMKSESIKILQSYYDPIQLPTLDPAFEALDVFINPKPELREFQIYQMIKDDVQYQNYDYLGLMSHKFNAKTNIKGSDFLAFVKNNPEYDVYFITLFPQNHIFLTTSGIMAKVTTQV